MSRLGAWRAGRRRNARNGAEDPHDGANFDIVVGHYYGSRDADPDDPSRVEYRDMLASWESREGKLSSFYFCEHIRAAAATTDHDRLFSAGNPYRDRADLPLYGLVTRADHLERFVQDHLVGFQRRVSVDEIYAIQTIALACMDTLNADPAPEASAAKELRSVTCAKVEADLAHAEEYAHGVWQRRAQYQYLYGMGLGVLGVAAVLSVLVLALRALGQSADVSLRNPYVPWVLILGAVGAVLSVMQRLTSGNLRLGPDSSATENRTLGLFRPVIGSALGLAMLILVLGGLIPLHVPEDPETRSFFLAGLAFLAGFSERFAQDMIGVGKSSAIPAASGGNSGSAGEGTPTTS